MTCTVLCLRPAADFARLDALPPATLAVSFRSAWQNVERVLVHNEPPLHRAY